MDVTVTDYLLFFLGTSTQGHAECSDLLCKKCCHNATILAQQLHPPCQERQHRLTNAGGPVPNPPHATHVALAPSVVPTVSPQPIAAPPSAMAESTPQPSTPEPTQALSHSLLVWGAPVQSQSDYAMPLATMWQPATPAWLESRWEAAKEDDWRAQGKKAVITLQQTKRIQITTISWIEASHSKHLHLHLCLALILGETRKHFPTTNHRDIPQFSYRPTSQTRWSSWSQSRCVSWNLWHYTKMMGLPQPWYQAASQEEWCGSISKTSKWNWGSMYGAGQLPWFTRGNWEPETQQTGSITLGDNCELPKKTWRWQNRDWAHKLGRSGLQSISPGDNFELPKKM